MTCRGRLSEIDTQQPDFSGIFFMHGPVCLSSVMCFQGQKKPTEVGF